MPVRKTLKKFFGFKNKRIQTVILERQLAESITGLARDTHPKEFIAFLDGQIKSEVFRVSSLIYQPYWASKNSTATIIDFPLGMTVFGTVHSHPGPSNHPSNADLLFFSKYGMVHLIIKKPYQPEDIAAYDKNGGPISLSVE